MTPLELFHYQATHILPYREYLRYLGIDAKTVTHVQDIPYLPVRFFKTHVLYDHTTPAERIFTSSATTGMTPSRHYVAQLKAYRENCLSIFRQFYGAPSDYVILALLPSYLEREGSSLVYMVQAFMEESGHPQNGYYLYDRQHLYETLVACARTHQKTWLIGVSFALLDLAQEVSLSFPKLTVVETGGMKGRGVELRREELHSRLAQSFPASPIHSEYGMAELLSQAYACHGDAYFTPPPQMIVSIRNLNDPFSYEPDGTRGGINIMDLANVHSCAFLETEDLGVRTEDGRFQVLGRIPHAERRGCNMLIESV